MVKIAQVPGNIRQNVATIKLHKSAGIWTRSRMVKTSSGHWVRIGRLHKVHYA